MPVQDLNFHYHVVNYADVRLKHYHLHLLDLSYLLANVEDGLPWAAAVFVQ